MSARWYLFWKMQRIRIANEFYKTMMQINPYKKIIFSLFLNQRKR